MRRAPLLPAWSCNANLEPCSFNTRSNACTVPSDLSPTTFRRPLEKYGFCGELAAHTGWHLAADERRAGQSVQPGCADHPCEVYPSDSTLIPHLCRKPSTSETFWTRNYRKRWLLHHYTKQLLHSPDSFRSRNSSYTHQTAFTTETFYTNQPLHQKPFTANTFTPNSFCTWSNFTPDSFYTRNILC